MNLRRAEATSWNAKPELYTAQSVFGEPKGQEHCKNRWLVRTQVRGQGTSDPHKSSFSSLVCHCSSHEPSTTLSQTGLAFHFPHAALSLFLTSLRYLFKCHLTQEAFSED